MSEFEQNMKISRLAGALNILTETQSLELVKLDRPINYDVFAEKLTAVLEREDGKPDGQRDEGKVKILRTRLAQIENLNTVDKTYKPFFYFVLFDSNAATLQSTTAAFCNILEHEVELPSPRVF